MRFPKRDMPARIATGAFILHAGWEKWRGDEETAKGIHGMAVGTYPFLKDMEPTRFLKLLAAAEIGVGTALLAPFVPSRLAGTALTGFGTGLLGLYARTSSEERRLGKECVSPCRTRCPPDPSQTNSPKTQSQ